MLENTDSSMIRDAFNNKTIFITGHTGFKGSWLATWLRALGARVVGLALEPPTSPSHYTVARISHGIQDHLIDVRDGASLETAIQNAQPDFVFHLAAQALVRRSYECPVETWSTNLLGTLNLLEGLRRLEKPCVAVIITSDKCYENVEWVWGYRETDLLGGSDPYSASKSAVELAIRSHIRSFFPSESSLVRIASARAGNVIGGGDWATDRIVPDCVRAWSQGQPILLRNPHSTRPWQHVLEPLSGYLSLALALKVNEDLHGESFNFGPRAEQDKSVLELVEQMSMYWEGVGWKVASNASEKRYESGLLKLNCDKALCRLGWKAVMSFEDTIRLTAQWYEAYYREPDIIRHVTEENIATYTSLAKKMGMEWAN